MSGDEAEHPEVAPVPQLVYMARQVDVSTFYGDEPSRADIFVEEVERAWEAQPQLSKKRKLDVIHQNVGPVVRAEISCLDDATRNDPAKLLKKIAHIFGEKRSSSSLLQELLTTTQWAGESTRRFSHRCKIAYDNLTRRQQDLGEDITNIKILRDHFVDGLLDKSTQRYLREKLHTENNVSFVDIRDIAIRWSMDETPSRNAGVAAAQITQSQQFPSQSQRLPSQSQQPVQIQPPSQDQAPPQSSDSARLDRLEQLVTSLCEEMKASRQRQAPRNQRKCFRCGSSSHLVRSCPKPPQAGN